MSDAMLDARVDRLEAARARLADAEAQTQADPRALAAAQKRTEEQLTAVLSVEERSSLAADARDAGRLSPEEAHDLLRSDLILRGKATDGSDLFVVVEVSSVIDSRDVIRAARRGQLLVGSAATFTAQVIGVQATARTRSQLAAARRRGDARCRA